MCYRLRSYPISNQNNYVSFLQNRNIFLEQHDICFYNDWTQPQGYRREINKWKRFKDWILKLQSNKTKNLFHGRYFAFACRIELLIIAMKPFIWVSPEFSFHALAEVFWSCESDKSKYWFSPAAGMLWFLFFLNLSRCRAHPYLDLEHVLMKLISKVSNFFKNQFYTPIQNINIYVILYLYTERCNIKNIVLA